VELKKSRTTNFWTDYTKVVDFEGAGVYNPVWDFYFALDIRKHLSSVQ
jgi:hypothetical protein